MRLKKVSSSTKEKFDVTVVIPVYNSASVLTETLKSIDKQHYPISEIICVDDHSTDNCKDILENFWGASKFPVVVIKHRQNRGWAYSVNEALRRIQSTHVITLSADCLIKDTDGVSKLIHPFISNRHIVQSCSFMITSENTWESYPFWLKCLFARRVGKIQSGRNSSFCCFSVHALKNVGMFDQKSFHAGGEDVVIIHKLERIGRVVDVNTLVEHVHSRSSTFSLFDLIYKENQHAEAAGAAFLKINKPDFKTIGILSIRPMMVLSLFLPKVNIFGLSIVLLYSFLYTKIVYRSQWRNPRILLLPFVNISLLVCWVFYFFRGLMTQRQRL